MVTMVEWLVIPTINTKKMFRYFQRKTREINFLHFMCPFFQLLKNMGVNSYRFSIAWTRILPNGIGDVNQLGIDYYNNLINELIANNITPAVTLYHWDLPQALQEQGGWLNPEIAYWFENYARIVFKEFGDRVKIWITLNEPWVVSINGHSTGEMAPGMRGPGILEYKVAHNLIRSHAKAYRVYQNEFYETQLGKYL